MNIYAFKHHIISADRKKTTLCLVRMSDGTSRVLIAGDHTDMYTIDPNDLGSGWTTSDSGKGNSAFIDMFSPNPGRVLGLQFQGDQLKRFALDLPTSWALDTDQIVLYPDIVKRGGYAFTIFPRNLVKCD